MPHRHCKTCRSPLHADETQAECVSCLGKSHADAALSGTDCFPLLRVFSLASLRSWIAFFSESDSPLAPLPFSSCRDCEEKTTVAEDSSGRLQASSRQLNARVPHHHHREEHSTHLISVNMISIPRGCEQHDLELTKSWRAPYSSRICPSAHIS